MHSIPLRWSSSSPSIVYVRWPGSSCRSPTHCATWSLSAVQADGLKQLSFIFRKHLRDCIDSSIHAYLASYTIPPRSLYSDRPCLCLGTNSTRNTIDHSRDPSKLSHAILLPNTRDFGKLASLPCQASTRPAICKARSHLPRHSQGLTNEHIVPQLLSALRTSAAIALAVEKVQYLYRKRKRSCSAVEVERRYYRPQPRSQLTDIYLI